MQSVGVTPCQDACRSGGYTCSDKPGVFTIIIAAIVNPRNASKETKRRTPVFFIIIVVLLTAG